MIAAVRALTLALAVCAASQSAQAVQPDEILKDPAMEARARDISAELRCLVCQNQSIDDSDAPLARDLRLLVRERLRSGDSDGDVRAFLVRRYGEFVLLRPPFVWHTLLLWLGPLVVVLAAVAGLVRARRRPLADGDEPLSPEEEARIGSLQDAVSPSGQAALAAAPSDPGASSRSMSAAGTGRENR